MSNTIELMKCGHIIKTCLFAIEAKNNMSLRLQQMTLPAAAEP